jgi:chemotaxis protein MotB
MDKEIEKPDTTETKVKHSKGGKKTSGGKDTREGYYAGLTSGEAEMRYRRIRQPRRVLWSIAWSDLMMTMFILFAVLYIYQAANRDFSFGRQADVPTVPETTTETVSSPRVETLVESVDADASRRMGEETDTMRLRHLSDIGTVELEPDKAVRIVLPGDLLFDTGKADLKPSALGILGEVADAIRITDYRVNVVGHTDSVPMHSEKFTTNWELSAVRACTVARYLIERMGLSASRFYISGHAYLQPVAPNDTPANRAANRRVELVLTRDRPVVGDG